MPTCLRKLRNRFENFRSDVGIAPYKYVKEEPRMKKRIVSIALALILLIGTAGVASADISKLPKDVWKYFNPYSAALDSGDTEKIISTGEAYLDYLLTLPLDADSGCTAAYTRTSITRRSESPISSGR